MKNQSSIYFKHCESLDNMSNEERDKIEAQNSVCPDVYKEDNEDEQKDVNADLVQIVYIILDAKHPLLLVQKLYTILWTIVDSTKRDSGQRISDNVKLRVYIMKMTGKSSREIAVKCGISHMSVLNHIKSFDDKIINNINMFTHLCAKDDNEN